MKSTSANSWRCSVVVSKLIVLHYDVPFPSLGISFVGIKIVIVQWNKWLNNDANKFLL